MDAARSPATPRSCRRPSYPIHIYGPLFAGAEVRELPMINGAEQFFDAMVDRWQYSWPRPRVIVLSFPHNPTTTCVDLDFFQRVVDFARENDVVVVHDNAYADLGFDGYRPPSILQAEGAKECAVELYSMTKSFSMAGWRVAFMVGNAEVVAALAKLKSYLDYGTFQPIQIAATVTLNEVPDFPREVNEIYQTRRDVALRRPQPHRLGDRAAQGDDVRLGADPRAVPRDGLDRVRQDARDRGAGRGVTRCRLRSRRRRPRAVRADRERAAHRARPSAT